MIVSCNNCYRDFDDRDRAARVVEFPRARHKPEKWAVCSRKCAVVIVKEKKSDIREHAQWLLGQVKIRKVER
jgi:hypothetical protein